VLDISSNLIGNHSLPLATINLVVLLPQEGKYVTRVILFANQEKSWRVYIIPPWCLIIIYGTNLETCGHDHKLENIVIRGPLEGRISIIWVCNLVNTNPSVTSINMVIFIVRGVTNTELPSNRAPYKNHPPTIAGISKIDILTEVYKSFSTLECSLGCTASRIQDNMIIRALYAAVSIAPMRAIVYLQAG